MRNGRIAPNLRAVVALIAGLPAALGAQVVQIDETVPLEPTGEVRLEVVTHGVILESWDRAEVQVVGEYDSSVEELEIQSDAGDFDLELSFTGRESRGRPDGSRELTVRLPVGASVSVASVSGSVRLVRGPGATAANASVDLETVSGEIDFEGDASEVRVSTVSGSISLSGAAEDVDVETVSGRIQVEGDAPLISAETVSGRTSVVSGVPVRDLSMESVSGGISFDGTLASGGTIEAETFSGSVDLSFRDTPDARFRLETFSGSVDWDLPGVTNESVRSNRFLPGETASFQVGAGSGNVDASTHSGSISVRQD